MVDPNTAKTGLQALAVAIAEITEFAQDLATRPLPTKTACRSVHIAGLQAASRDLQALAAAMEVLERRRPAETKATGPPRRPIPR